MRRIVCPYCKKSNWRDEKRCNFCGQELAFPGQKIKYCPECDEEMDDAAEACEICGGKLERVDASTRDSFAGRQEDESWTSQVVYAERRLTYPGGSYEMVPIPGGEFMMGDGEFGPVHRVIVSGFLMGRTEVTQGLWRAVLGTEPSPDNLYDGEMNGHPANHVSWSHCREFIGELNRLTMGYFRLPTEAEWEYACRAGTTGERYGELEKIALYKGNSGGFLSVVGKGQPNAWGLYDMLGSTCEWCQDWYDPSYYSRSPLHDPKGPENGRTRVARGGSFDIGARYVTSSYRNGYDPVKGFPFNGFRLARYE